jgi:5'-methylthioadenosine phosphorylase
MKEHAEIGIIGGSGLYEMEGFSSEAEVTPETPFGRPSDAIVIGELEGRRVAFLPRHGRGHRILPSELNFRANIFAMKALGVHTIYSVSAVGSLKEEYAPLHVVVPDQFVDRTFARPTTFFGRGLVAHVAFAHPISRRPCTTWAAPTSASRGRSSPRAPSPSCTARGAWTSSA